MPIIRVPLELKPVFLQNPENFLRDIACIPTESIRPYFRQRSKISEIEAKAHKNPFNDELRAFDPDFSCSVGDVFARYMHVDLGVTRDAVGISMCHTPYFVDRIVNVVSREGVKVENVRLPFIHFDFVGRIKVSKGEEILLSFIRDLVYDLRQRGFYLALITYDGFQSIDSIQILRGQGFNVGRLSVQRTSTKLILDKYAKDGSGLSRKSTDGQILSAMQALKDPLYDDRLAIPFHPFWMKEAKGAEINYKKNKVDHKPRGSIDLLQSMAGSAYNLINNEFEYIEETAEETRATEDDFYDKLPPSDFATDYYPENPEEGSIEAAERDREW